MGEAFQLRDDVLGVFGDPALTGKPAGDDLREGKRTVLVAVAEERSSPAERQTIGRHLGDARLGQHEIDELRDIIGSTGALDYVESLIDERVGEARAAIADIPEPAASVLRSLAEAATQRVH
jgi:geranylgeranyl diphosphate synthase type I